MQRPQSIQNEQLQGQKQHFLEAQSLVSPDKPKNKDAHINWQIDSPLKRERSCVKLYPFPIQPIKGNNCGLIPYKMEMESDHKESRQLVDRTIRRHILRQLVDFTIEQTNYTKQHFLQDVMLNISSVLISILRSTINDIFSKFHSLIKVWSL